MNMILEAILKFALGKKIIELLAIVHNGLDGKRSEIVIILLAVVHVLKISEVIPSPAATSIEQSLFSILPLTLSDRASKIIKIVDDITPH